MTLQDIVIFDLEIKKEIGKNGIGWTSFDKMGISVGVTYSFLGDEYKVFMDDNLEEMGNLLSSANMISGFNTHSFDLLLLKAHIPNLRMEDLFNKNYDMLVHSRISSSRTGHIPGFKLDQHLFHIFGKEAMKTGNGADAPVWWGQGKEGQVVSYCVDDVKRESMLLKHFWEEGWTKTEHGQFPLKTGPKEFIESLRETKNFF